MAKVEVIKSEKADKKNYFWVIFIVIFAVLIFGGVLIAVIANDESSTNNDSNTNNEANSDEAKYLYDYLDTPLSGCPNKTLKEGADALVSSNELEVSIDEKVVNGENKVYITVTGPEMNTVATVTKFEGKILFTEGSDDSLIGTKYENDMEFYIGVLLGKMLCED